MGFAGMEWMLGCELCIGLRTLGSICLALRCLEVEENVLLVCLVNFGGVDRLVGFLWVWRCGDLGLCLRALR